MYGKIKTYREMIVVENKRALKALIEYRIATEGVNCDLNDIDISKVDDLSELLER